MEIGSGKAEFGMGVRGAEGIAQSAEKEDDRKQMTGGRGQRDLISEFGPPWCDLIGLDYFRLD